MSGEVGSRPRLLDLFCGAGGATKGYQEAGFYVVGVDIVPQPNYCGDEFWQADALTYMDWFCGDDPAPDRNCCTGHREFAAIHASPPCQAFTALKDMHNARKHADLLTPTRERLVATGLPYVIENVPGAPMIEPITLCGSAFGLEAEDAQLRRHRLFEMSFPAMAPPCAHGRASRVIGVYGGHRRDRRRVPNAVDFSADAGRQAMGIDWMTGEELSQAIPPAYTEYIGSCLLAHLEKEPQPA